MVATTLTAKSRFPDSGDYDARRHVYRADYITPSSYEVELSVRGDLPFERFTAPAQPPLNRPVVIDHWITPDDVRGYRWKLTQHDGTEVTAHTTGAKNWVPGQVSVSLARVGAYTVEVAEELVGGGERVTRSSWTLRDDLVICLGDSYASGEGNPDGFGSPTAVGRAQCGNTTMQIKFGWPPVDMSEDAHWIEPRAHRSFRSGHARAAERAQRPDRTITFLSFASSGAQVEKGLLGPQHDWQQRFGGQVVEAYAAVTGRRRVSVVLLSIGGNDVGFSAGLETLAADWRSGGLQEMERSTRRRIRELGPKLDRLNDTIRSRLAPRAILISEYPTAFFDAPGGGRTNGCGVFATTAWMKVSAVDAAHIWGLGKTLNAELESAASRNGWIFVSGIEEGFAGHGYCTDSSFYVGAAQSCRRQSDFLGTMHPNGAGHAVYAKCVGRHLSEALTAPRPRPGDLGPDDVANPGPAKRS